MTQFSVQVGNITAVPSDLLLLKHAQAFYGADLAVATCLISAHLCTEAELSPAPGEFALVETNGVTAPSRVLFLGTPRLDRFRYREMYEFALQAIEKIAELGLQVGTLTTTIHGAGYGLDGGESLQRLALGFQDGLAKHSSTSIDRIVFLTIKEREARLLNATLEEMQLAGAKLVGGTSHGQDRPITEPPVPAPGKGEGVPALAAAVNEEAGKKRVFVALPYSEEFQNVYDFGIYPAVRNCGMICERVDETHFVGDVLPRIRKGIETASLVIADLSEGRPNVYLEVGYAWGKGVPVIFVARKGEQLHFDVSTHRCIFYGRFTQFANDLENLIRGIQASSPS